MIMRLVMPAYDRSMSGGHLVKWYKEVGEPFSFGDTLCAIDMNEFAVLRRTARATKLSGRRRKRLKSELEVREGKVSLAVSIRAAESGRLVEIATREGEGVAIGDVLAVVSTDEADPHPTVWTSSPPLRVVVNPIQEVH